MKRFMLTVAAAALVLPAMSFGSGERPHGMPDGGMGGMEGCPLMGKGGKGGMCPMHGGMGKMLLEREVVATQDGGIVVLMGNKLSKYDADLNLKKEVEIKPDVEGLKNAMKQLRESCESMCGEKMDKGKCEKGKRSGHKKHGAEEEAKEHGAAEPPAEAEK